MEPVPPGLDPGIELAVRILMEAGIETFESCQGGAGHSYPEPTVRFHGQRPEGFKALAVAMYDGRLKVKCLRRIWTINDGEPTGPYWEMVYEAQTLKQEQTLPSEKEAKSAQDERQAAEV